MRDRSQGYLWWMCVPMTRLSVAGDVDLPPLQTSLSCCHTHFDSIPSILSLPFSWTIKALGVGLFSHLTLMKGIKICHPEIYHFGLRVILSWKQLRKSRHQKITSVFVSLSTSRTWLSFISRNRTGQRDGPGIRLHNLISNLIFHKFL